jgi:NAD(P)-dependent dehydrogenase (short-subunit alcohol dehydrogenase family)
MSGNGKVVIIVGASTGIGKQLSERLATSGYGVVMASRSLDKGLKNKADLIAKCGPGSEKRIEFVQTDVADRGQMKNLWDTTWGFKRGRHLRNPNILTKRLSFRVELRNSGPVII